MDLQEIDGQDWDDDAYEDWKYDQMFPPKEEPDCGGCCDQGTVRAGRLGHLFGRKTIGCPSCNPDRITRLYQRSRLWKARGWLRSLRHRNETSTDESPF